MSKLLRIFAMVFLCLNFACHDHHHKHDHSEEHPPGHDHHAEGHGHDGEATIAATLWSKSYEYFTEHPPGIVGQQLSYLIHLTHLVDFKSLNKANLSLELEGPASLKGTSSKAIRPGIFIIKVTPKKAGNYQGRLRVSAHSTEDFIEGIKLKVFKSEKEAEEVPSDEDDHGLIEFLKEQQWKVDFNTQFTKNASLISSREFSGRIESAADGQADVASLVTGRVLAPNTGFPLVGSKVRKGQLLALLIPAPSSPEAAVNTDLAVTKAQAKLSAAQLALSRAKRLFKNEAISKRELEDAKRKLLITQKSIRAAKRSADLFSGAIGAKGQGTWRLTAPINGIISHVSAKAGMAVAPGETLFKIQDPNKVWIVAKIPEKEVSLINTKHNPSFKFMADRLWQPLNIIGNDANASLVTMGSTVDRVSRTVDLIYSLKMGSNSMLRPGSLILVNLALGQKYKGIVIPKSAVINLDGISVVFIQADGEHFEQRVVELGPQNGNFIAIKKGLKAGERIVTKGAVLLRLAESSKGAPAHGHIH